MSLKTDEAALLVVVNPFAGNSNGKKIYQDKVAPTFSRYGLKTEIVETTHAGLRHQHLLGINPWGN